MGHPGMARISVGLTKLTDEINITLKIEGNALDTFTLENHPKLQ